MCTTSTVACETLDTLKLVIVGYPLWVLGTEFRSPATVVNTQLSQFSALLVDLA